MNKIKDFYGKDITTVMRDACLSFDVSQEELEIEVLETGSPGIFGLCKKKARIRAQLKKSSSNDLSNDSKPAALEKKDEKHPRPARKTKKTKEKENKQADKQKSTVTELSEKKMNAEQNGQTGEAGRKKSSPNQQKQHPEEPVLPPSDKVLASLQEDISRLFVLTGYPMQVRVTVEEDALQCHLSGEHEEPLIGDDGRILNTLQYLLRKMMSRRLPERMLLTLDVGNFRQRRLEELKGKALQMAVEVRETGKTLMIPALNPAERREIHIILRGDKAIRSRSVGDGLFKKVLIYKPAKSAGRSSSRRQKPESVTKKH